MKLSKKTCLTMVGMISLSLLNFQNLLGQNQINKKIKFDVENLFLATGFMGDGEYGTKYVILDGSCNSSPHSAPTCMKIKYSFGPQGWAGVYWQNRHDNWGDWAGNNYSNKKLTKVTFWAKGETGREVLEFKSGGISNPKKQYHDSYEVTTGRVTLSKEWSKYAIDLTGLDLSSVIGGFCWVAAQDYNGLPFIVFYIDDINIE
jgi:hypothetical protein